MEPEPISPLPSPGLLILHSRDYLDSYPPGPLSSQGSSQGHRIMEDSHSLAGLNSALSRVTLATKKPHWLCYGWPILSKFKR